MEPTRRKRGERVSWKLPRLRELREARFLSLRGLAELSGVHHDTLFRLEHGQQGAYPATIHKLAKALGVEPVELTKPAE